MPDTIQKATFDDRGNLASNCSQIFAKGPQLTKDIVTKMKRADLGNDRKFLCGHEFKTRHIWVLASLIILFACSFFGCIVLWFTNYFDIILLKNLELNNGSRAYESLINPDVESLVGVHIFNYTNVRDFEKGYADKLHVKDIGPYVFQETRKLVNPVFGDDGTLTFQESRSYKFMPELSNGRKQSDQIVVPNLPMLGTIAMVKDTYFMTRLTLATVLKGLDAKPFLKLPAHRFIWGYEDSFFTLVKNVLSFQHEQLPFEKFGLLAMRNGTSPDRITVSTGVGNIDTVGTIVKYNGQEKMDHWSTNECNRIDGTTGSFFSPYTIRAKKPVSIYLKDICKKFSLHYQEEVDVLPGYKGYRYAPYKNIFAHPDIEPANQCFCDMETGVCPPHGIMNSTPCSFGPAYLSFPHFLYGDTDLQEAVTGLKPDDEEHSSFLDVHPRMGYVMQGHTRLQLNMLVRKAYGIPQTDMFTDNTMLPVAWFDNGLRAEDLPQTAQDVFYLTTYTVAYIETGMKYGCFLMTLVTMISIVLMIQGRLRSKRPIRTIPPFQRNISGLDALIN